MGERCGGRFRLASRFPESHASKLRQRVSDSVKSKWWRPWTVAFLLLAGGLIALTLRHREVEPVWKGRPLSEWVDDLARGSSKEVREPAAEAVRSIGSDGLPCLIRTLRARDTVWDRTRLTLNRKQKRVHFSVLPARERRVQAALAF